MELSQTGPGAGRLLEIVKIQTEIAAAKLELGKVIELVAEKAKAITESDGAVVELAEGADMVYRGASGIAAKQLGLRILRKGSLSGMCIDEGRALRCDDSETDLRVNREACRAVGLRSMIVIPLKYRNIAVGVLKVLSAEASFFDEEDIQTLDLMSGRIASSMAHASAFESQREEAEQLFFHATHDTLTGLGNRSLFYEHLRSNLALARRNQGLMGVAMLDMDGLKTMNDRFGHKAGDFAIKTLASRLKNSARDSDTVARLGGDEFAVIVPEVPDRQSFSDIGRGLVERVEGPFEFEGTAFDLKASLGLALFPDDGAEADSLLHSADEAMYEIKRGRKGPGAR